MVLDTVVYKWLGDRWIVLTVVTVSVGKELDGDSVYLIAVHQVNRNKHDCLMQNNIVK